MKKFTCTLAIIFIMFSFYGCDNGSTGAVPGADNITADSGSNPAPNDKGIVFAITMGEDGKLTKGGGGGPDMGIDEVSDIVIPADQEIIWQKFVDWRKNKVKFVDVYVSDTDDTNITYFQTVDQINGLCQADFELPYGKYGVNINAYWVNDDGYYLTEFSGTFEIEVSADGVRYFEFNLAPYEYVSVPCVIDQPKGQPEDYEIINPCGDCGDCCPGNPTFYLWLKNQADPVTWATRFTTYSDAIYKDGKLYFILQVSQNFILENQEMFPSVNKGLFLNISDYAGAFSHDYALVFEPDTAYEIMMFDGLVHLRSLPTVSTSVGFTIN